jgi:cytosine/adenosine deaminase-related metal-dependent hydrolase
VKTILAASHIAPMTGAVTRDGAVMFDAGRVQAVGAARELRAAHPAAKVVDLGDAVVLPGLVNPHVHLELTGVRRPQPAPPTFVDWILAVRESMAAVRDFPSFIKASTSSGIRQCRHFGVTAVGDISLNPSLTRPRLAEHFVRGVSFGEVLGMAGRRGQFEGRLAEAVDRSFDAGGLRAGVGPHAPYSLDLEGYRRCVEGAERLGMPLATHLAETPEEAKFLARHKGEFRRLWEALGGWEEGVPTDDGGPVRAMKRVGLLDHSPTALAHLNVLDDDELELLAASRASVVYCPRTHEYFGRPPHRFREMLDRGINVAIGTDSCASSPDLNVVEDLRLVRRQCPEMSASELFEMVTTRAAQALGMAGDVGAIQPGAWADFCMFPIPSGSADPLLAILESDVVPRELWVGGQRV